jgi:hypothetical protein
MDLCGSEQDPVADTCEHRKEISSSVKWGELLDRLTLSFWRGPCAMESVSYMGQDPTMKPHEVAENCPMTWSLRLNFVLRARQLNNITWPLWQWHDRLTSRLSFLFFAVTHQRSYIIRNLTDNPRRMWRVRQIACTMKKEMNTTFLTENINGRSWLIDQY